MCFSKGLGCPLGAVLAGSAELIERAWVEKFRFGGAMRQAGIVAAAALHALDHHVERLAEDLGGARRLSLRLASRASRSSRPRRTSSRSRSRGATKPRPCVGSRTRVLLSGLRPGWLQAVTFLGVEDADVDGAAELIPRVLGALVRA